MPKPWDDLFRVFYDWDEGLWTLLVAGSFRKTYREEKDAEGAKSDLLKLLASAPNGDTRSVLKRWAKETP